MATNVNYVYPDWREEPPDGYPFTYNLIPDALQHARFELPNEVRTK